MSRKTLIICISVLILMVGGIAASVVLLYSGTSTGKKDAVQIAEDYTLLPAVPADAVAVFCFSDASEAWQMTPFFDLNCEMTVSLHYSARLVPLYIFDVGKASNDISDEAQAVIDVVKKQGLQYQYLDCSKMAGGDKKISKRSIVLASASEVILRSSVRHLEKNVSVMDLEGFSEASDSINGDNVMFVSDEQSYRLFGAVLPRSLSPWSDFATRVGSWTVAEIQNVGPGGITISGRALNEGVSSEFMSVLSTLEPSQSQVAGVLPSYTFSALSLSVKEMEDYISAYELFLDSRQMLQKSVSDAATLTSKTGVAPKDYFRSQKPMEVVTASFVSGSVLQRVNLVRFDNPDISQIFKGTDIASLRGYVPAIHPYQYGSFLSSVFGRIFSLKDESYFTYIDGWVVSGSRSAVEEYVSGRVLEYTLQENLEDAGRKELWGSKSAALTAYFSLSASETKLGDVIRKDAMSLLSPLREGADICPIVLTVGSNKDKSAFQASLNCLKLEKVKAPVFERDTVVNVPRGPFKVKNCATGKTNLFYQQDNLYICLKEENGKGLWGIPFDKNICGAAHNVDYFNNGKIQFLFGAGSSIYLIDRLGRFVSGFPVNLGKEILIGPDVYDFNSSKRYNIMVLHKDNTIEMYNLKGKKPSTWKGIKASETIKGLPERIVIGGKSVWVVRTSIQTLIFPFDGGEPLYLASGDKMIRTDSKVMRTGNTLEFTCYDGKIRNLVL